MTDQWGLEKESRSLNSKKVSISRPIYTKRSFKIDSFMYLPSVLCFKRYNNDAYTVLSNVTLNIRYIPYNRTSILPTDVFRITIKNHYSVLRFFNTILGWFDHPDMQDLFLRDTDGTLIFNYDYKELNAKVSGGYMTTNMMKAIPAVIEIEQGNFVEGIILHINLEENAIRLTYTELEEIFNVIQSFNFNTEVVTCLLSLQNAIASGNVTMSNSNGTNIPKW